MTRTDLSSTTSDTPSSIEQDRTWLEGIARHFDAAWKRGDKPALTDFLPPSKTFTELLESLHGDERRSLGPVELNALLLELSRIDLAHRLAAGEPARVETYMERFPELASDVELLLELIVTEYQERLRREPGLPIEGYLARFPGQRDELAARLGNLTALPEPGDGAPPGGGPGPWPVIKDYTIIEIIKEGGQGVVYKARQERLNRIVAVKVIHRERWANTEWARKRFAQEARAAAQLMHSHIAIVHDFNQSDDVDYIVMEFVDGVNLQDLVQRSGPLPVDEACEYMRQAALGLQHAHERGLVHRDVKPGNLIVTLPSGGTSAGGKPLPFRGAIVKILDMGLARLSVQPGGHEDDTPVGHGAYLEPASERTPPGSIMGTPDFIAPEQWEDARTTDIRADLYSLGCTFYYLLAAAVPFPGGSVSTKRKKHRLGTARPVRELRAEVPEEIESVVSKLMAKNPDERFQTPEELASHLKDFLRSRNVKQTKTQSWPDFMLQPQGPRRGETRPLCRLLGHADWIWSVAFSPSGQYVLSGSRDRTARLWSLEDRTEVRRFAGHEDDVLSVTFNADGTQIATGCADRIVRVWQTKSTKELHRFIGHTDRVLRVAFSQAQLDWLFELLNVGVDYQARGDLVVSGSRDGSIRLWHPTLGDVPLRRLDIRSEIVSVAFSFDGISALTQSGGHLVQLWGVENDRELCRFEAESNFFWSVALSPDGRRVLSGGDDGTVRLWDVDTGQELRRFRGHRAFVYCVSFSPDGRQALSGSDDKTVRLWDLVTGQELSCFVGHEDGVNSVAFSLDGQFAVSGSNDRSLCVWAVQT